MALKAQNKSPKRPFSYVIGRLRSAGLRPTRQRLALAKLLFEGKDRHVTAEQLYNESQKSKNRVSLATVYNTLHQFTDVGLLREIAIDSSKLYYDTNISDHHHFYFNDIETLEDIESEKIKVSLLPDPPDGTEIQRLEIVVRLSKKTNNNN